MSLASVTARGRAAAEARMTSSCAVMRKTGGSTLVGGFKVPVWETVYTGSVRVAGANAGSAQSRRVTAGDLDLSVPVRVASFPYGTELRDGDLVDVTAGDTAGVVFRVVETDPQDQATALRVTVVGTARPGEWA